MKALLSLLLSLCFFYGNLKAQVDYEIVVATDFDGKVTQGSIEDLITEIRKGKPVRVGWQLDFDQDKQADFDHWVDAEFITILGQHVFTQIETIFIQGPNLATPQVEIFPSSDQWTAVIGTNSKLLNRFIFHKDPKLGGVDGQPIDSTTAVQQIADLKKVDTWMVATFWAVPR
ncbi:MAG: hypothetical protein KTR30_11375 [Saprospiraceae bacterium]|nr:hypothetical protein [Saprospiraceae bacterium]